MLLNTIVPCHVVSSAVKRGTELDLEEELQTLLSFERGYFGTSVRNNMLQGPVIALWCVFARVAWRLGSR